MTNPLPENAVVWAEIPVTDMDRAKRFYASVVGNELIDNHDGPNPMADFPRAKEQSVGGHLYPGKPAKNGTGNTIHLSVSGTVDAALERVKQAGGEVVSPVIEIPAGRFAYCLDLDGNSIGIFGS
jgi:predicted enzyme related to lactoylglutathione lyase